MTDTDDWARKKALHLVRVEHGLRGPSSYDMVDDIASALRDARREGIEAAIALTVLTHPGFFRVERTHWVHRGECPQPPEECDGVYPCFRYDVGVALTEGRVDWEHGATVGDALAKMADRIRALAAGGKAE